MAVIQAVYNNTHDQIVNGQVFNTTSSDVDSFVANEVIPFGRGVSRYGDTMVGAPANVAKLGAERTRIGRTSAAVTADATTVTIDPDDDAGVHAVRAGAHYLIDDEIVYISSLASNTATISRGQLGTTAAVHDDLTPITPLQVNVHFLGIAVMDERVRATPTAVAAGQYAQGEIVAVMYRGDVVVTAPESVAPGDHVVTDVDGRLSAEFPGDDHILIPGAQWRTARDANNLAVVRLPGPVTAVAGILH